MNNTPDDIWEEVAPQLRRHVGLGDLTMEEAQAAYDDASEESLSDGDLQAIIDFANGKARPVVRTPERKHWLQGLRDTFDTTGLTLALNRNAGAEDPEVLARMELRRKEALGESTGDEEKNTGSDRPPEDE